MSYDGSCEGCSVCGEDDCGWMFDCGSHVHALSQTQLRLARWSLFVRLARAANFVIYL